ncbi:hypothetical protein ACT4UT_37135, partial [Bacillus sp. B-TM1]
SNNLAVALLVNFIYEMDIEERHAVLNLGSGLSAFVGPLVVTAFIGPLGVGGVMWIFAGLYFFGATNADNPEPKFKTDIAAPLFSGDKDGTKAVRGT